MPEKRTPAPAAEVPPIEEFESLSRGQLLKMAGKLTQMAMEVNDAENRLSSPKRSGEPKDPAVRRLAGLHLHWLHEHEKMSFEDIGNLVGISRNRAWQLYGDLVPDDFTRWRTDASRDNK